MTQVQLARAAGVPDSTVRNVESGRTGSTRRPTTWPMIATALGWDPTTSWEDIHSERPPHRAAGHEPELRYPSEPGLQEMWEAAQRYYPDVADAMMYAAEGVLGALRRGRQRHQGEPRYRAG